MPFSLGYLKKLQNASEESAEAFLAALNKEDHITVGGKAGGRSLFTKKELRGVEHRNAKGVLISSESMKKEALLYSSKTKDLPDELALIVWKFAFKFDSKFISTTLNLAAHNGNLPAIRKLLELPGVVITPEGWSDAYLNAIRAGHLDATKFTLKMSGMKFSNFDRFFIDAARDGHQGIMEWILAMPSIVISPNAWIEALDYAKCRVQIGKGPGAMNFILTKMFIANIAYEESISFILKNRDYVAHEVWNKAFECVGLNNLDRDSLNRMKLILKTPNLVIDNDSWNKVFKKATSWGRVSVMKFILARPDVVITPESWRDILSTDLKLTKQLVSKNIINAISSDNKKVLRDISAALGQILSEGEDAEYSRFLAHIQQLIERPIEEAMGAGAGAGAGIACSRRGREDDDVAARSVQSRTEGQGAAGAGFVAAEQARRAESPAHAGAGRG